MPATQIYADLERRRQNVHKWGASNRIIFEASKEEKVIVHPTAGNGKNFPAHLLERDEGFPS